MLNSNLKSAYMKKSKLDESENIKKVKNTDFWTVIWL